MSLINQMLQDLEQRRAAGAPLPIDQSQVRAVLAPPRMHIAWWLALVLLAALLALGLWSWQHSPRAMRVPPAAVAAPLAARVAAPAPPSPMPAPAPAASAPMAAGGIAAAAPAAAAPTVPGGVPAAVPVAVASAPPAAAATSAPASTPVPALAAVPAAAIPEPEKTANRTPSPALPSALAANTGKGPPASAVSAASAEHALPKLAPHRASPAPMASPPGVAASADGAQAQPGIAPLGKEMRAPTPQQQAENDFRKAVALIQQGNAAAAQAALEQALQADPRHAAARQTLAGLLLDAKHVQAALDTLQAGLQLDPAQPGMAMILARIQMENGALGSALATLQRSLPYGAERADYQAFLAALLQREKRHPEAIEHYQQALRKAPQNGLWWMGLGISLRAAARPGDAREAFNRAAGSNLLSPPLRAFVEQQLQQLPGDQQGRSSGRDVP